MTDAQPLSSALDDALGRFYFDLDDVDSKAANALAKSYSDTIDVLKPKFEKALVDAAAGGGPNKAFMTQRLGSLLSQAEAAWYDHAGAGAGILTQAQTDAATLGSRMSGDMIRSTFDNVPNGVSLAKGFDYLPKSAIQEIAGSLMDGSPVSSLVNAVAGGMANEMKRLLVTGLATGVNPRETARLIGKAFDAQQARLNTIVRTETLRAAREGSRKNMLNHTDVVKGWQWYSRRDRRTCAVCFAMHGEQFELKTKMATHPNCRCTMIPVTKTWQELGFSSAVPNAENPAFATASADMLKADSALCRSALGRGGCLGFTEGLLPLDRFVNNTYHPQWGYGRTAASLKSMVGPTDARTLSRGIVPPGLKPLTPVGRKNPLPQPLGPLSGTPPPVAVSPPALAARPLSPPHGAPAKIPGVTDVPVSDALTLDVSPTRSKYGRDLKAALDVLDSVHTDGLLPRIPLKNMSSNQALGWYKRTLPNEAIEIAIDKSGTGREAKLWHAVGHFLDNQALYKGPLNVAQPFASEAAITPEWAAYHAAVDASENMIFKRSAVGQSTVVNSLGLKAAVDQSHLAYLLRPRETFARAYAQYIAVESGNGGVGSALEFAQLGDRVWPSPHATVWQPADFEPIREAVDNILKAEGWK